MPFTAHRNRVVVFRLSQDEYDTLKAACATAGGRNLSDYTRSELLASIHSGSIAEVIQRRFMEFDRRLADLHNLVERVSARIDEASEKSTQES